MEYPGYQAEQMALGKYQNDYCICKNRPECDEHWDSSEPEWVGKASMSERHRFLTTRNLHWSMFNALIFGLVPQEEGGNSLTKVIAEVEGMRAAALTYTMNVGGWSDQVGLFFHVFGHNTVNSLHMHILDLKVTGPTFEYFSYKNCKVEDILKVLHEELDAREPEKKKAETKEAMSLAAQAVKTASMAAQAAARIATTSVDTRIFIEGEESSGLVELNVGGELMMTVERTTFLLAPEGSLLREMFSAGWDSEKLKGDSQGRIFLDFPPAPFKRIVDHLRLLKVTPKDELLPPPVCYKDYEFQALVRVLGLEDFLLKEPQAGMGKAFGRAQGSVPRVAPLCPSRRGANTQVALCSIA